MGLAEGPPQGNCRGSIRRCLRDVSYHRLARVINLNLDVVPCSANGLYVKIRRMGLAEGPPQGTSRGSIRWCLREVSYHRLARVINVRSVAWALHKVRRMDLAQGPPHATCKGSIGWCLCESSHQVLARVNAKLDAVRSSANGPYVRSVAWTLHKVRRMGLAEGSPHGTCKRSIRCCLREAIRRKLFRIINTDSDAVRSSANGPYVKSVAWTLRKVRRMGLAEGPPYGTCKRSIRCCLREVSHQRVARVNSKPDAEPSSANGPYVAWTLHKVRRMGLAEGPPYGTYKRSIRCCLRKVSHQRLARANAKLDAAPSSANGPDVAWTLREVRRMGLA
eukprot:6213791-Pleurochrysis_carterae.AAC.5